MENLYQESEKTSSNNGSEVVESTLPDTHESNPRAGSSCLLRPDEASVDAAAFLRAEVQGAPSSCMLQATTNTTCTDP